jgi:hypothetical protein
VRCDTSPRDSARASTCPQATGETTYKGESREKQRLIRIIWPHHPLYLRQVPLVEIWEGSGRGLMIELPDGSHTRIPSSWADNGEGAIPEVSPGQVLSLGAVRDLVGVLEKLVERIRGQQ